MKNLKEKSIQASKRYLEHRDYEVLDINYPVMNGAEIDIVAKDENGIIFVDVIANGNGEDGLPRENTSEVSREVHEQAAIEWLKSHPEEGIDVPIRFDIIALVVVGSDRALIRHHINCFGYSTPQLDSAEDKQAVAAA